MLFTRRRFVIALLGGSLLPLRGRASPPPTLSNAAPAPTDATGDGLTRWLRARRHEVDSSADDRATTILLAMAAGQAVEFTNVHGDARLVVPETLFTVEGYPGTYLRGYCHTADAERTFHLDRLTALRRCETMIIDPQPLSPAATDVT